MLQNGRKSTDVGDACKGQYNFKKESLLSVLAIELLRILFSKPLEYRKAET